MWHHRHRRLGRLATVNSRTVTFSRREDSVCVDPDPADTVADRINTLLNSSGPGYVLQLCPNREYILQTPIYFAAPNQEISTEGYPTDDSRATLIVNGPVANGTGHTTAVDGTCADCSNIMLRNVQINGARHVAPPTSGGANIEFGGGNGNQTVQFVRSYDPRGWSCLHVAEGPFTCNNAVIQNNDIGPCGVDTFQEWADGISVSCKDSTVRNNMIQGPTDGGIVLFGSPGTKVYNNTIWIVNNTLLGGINMVDYLPWQGNYSNTVVKNNTIVGGYATSTDPHNDKLGPNQADVIIKIGIAVGPRTWFGDRYLANTSSNGVVEDNRLSGAFGYGIAISSASNFTISNNVLFGNSSFIGASGANCSKTVAVPDPAPFIYDNTAVGTTLQTEFQLVADASSLSCIIPPLNGDYWPFGHDPDSFYESSNATQYSAISPAGVLIGVFVALLLSAS